MAFTVGDLVGSLARDIGRSIEEMDQREDLFVAVAETEVTLVLQAEFDGEREGGEMEAQFPIGAQRTWLNEEQVKALGTPLRAIATVHDSALQPNLTVKVLFAPRGGE